jgi:hypothetical protein
LSISFFFSSVEKTTSFIPPFFKYWLHPNPFVALAPSVSGCKGSRKNKLAILGVEAPGRQGAKMQEYLDIPSFHNAAGRDVSAFKM